MLNIENDLQDYPLVSFREGEHVLIQGEYTDNLYFLSEGDVSIIRDDVEVSLTSEKCSVFGESSLLLSCENTTSVRCLKDSTFYCVDCPKKFIAEHPTAMLHMAKTLCVRLANSNQYLVDVRHLYDAEQHKKAILGAIERMQ